MVNPDLLLPKSCFASKKKRNDNTKPWFSSSPSFSLIKSESFANLCIRQMSGLHVDIPNFIQCTPSKVRLTFSPVKTFRWVHLPDIPTRSIFFIHKSFSDIASTLSSPVSTSILPRDVWTLDLELSRPDQVQHTNPSPSSCGQTQTI